MPARGTRAGLASVASVLRVVFYGSGYVDRSSLPHRRKQDMPQRHTGQGFQTAEGSHENLGGLQEGGESNLS